MKQIYFITATNTNIGKTYASEIFLNKYAKMDKKVGYFKPFETGVIDKPNDGTKLLNLTKKLNKEFDFTINEIVPFQFKLPAAPFVSALNENKTIKINIVFDMIDKLLDKCDVLIIEGAGGLLVPLLDNYFIVDLIVDIQKKYNSKTILITPSNLGSINDTLLSQYLLKNKNIDFDWYINLYKDKEDFNKVTLPFYSKYFIKIDYLIEEK